MTTSWFGRASEAFANERGRLELLDGANLVHLFKEHMNLDVIPGSVPPLRGSGVSVGFFASEAPLPYSGRESHGSSGSADGGDDRPRLPWLVRGRRQVRLLAR